MISKGLSLGENQDHCIHTMETGTDQDSGLGTNWSIRPANKWMNPRRTKMKRGGDVEMGRMAGGKLRYIRPTPKRAGTMQRQEPLTWPPQAPFYARHIPRLSFGILQIFLAARFPFGSPDGMPTDRFPVGYAYPLFSCAPDQAPNPQAECSSGRQGTMDALDLLEEC